MRYLPQRNELQEHTRVINRVWDEIDRLNQSLTGGTKTRVVFSNAPSLLGVGSVSASVSIPAWIRTLTPPFAVLDCNNLGELATDTDGCGILKMVLS
jgi:hypothetical protein